MLKPLWRDFVWLTKLMTNDFFSFEIEWIDVIWHVQDEQYVCLRRLTFCRRKNNEKWGVFVTLRTVKLIWPLFGMLCAYYEEKKEEIWRIPMTKTTTPTETSKKQSDNTQKNANKTSITQRLRTDLGWSVGVTTVCILVWFILFTGSKPFH